MPRLQNLLANWSSPAARALASVFISPHRLPAFAVALIAVALPRLLFFFAQPLPYYLQFNPGCSLVPLAGILCGPAGVWGAVAGTVLADLLIGLGSALTPFRAAGAGLFALSAWLIWNRLPTTSFPLRFLLSILPGIALDAVWLGWGSECLRLYPFPYVATLTLIQNSVFVPVVGLPLILLFRERLDRASTSSVALSETAQDILTIIAWSSWLIGVVMAYRRYHIRPLDPFVIGVTDCPAVLFAVLPLLLLQLALIFLQKRK